MSNNLRPLQVDRDTLNGDKGTRTPDLVSAIDALSQLSYIPNGDKGTRTPDLLGASEALSQLSYVPSG